jgi:predicted O-methyltransferase YrrM
VISHPESTWTAPRPDCPYPERWNATDEDSTEVEVSEFVGALVRALQPDLVLETGTAWGQTALHIGHALVQNGQGKLITLEVDPERVSASRRRTALLPVEVREEPSLDYTPARWIDFAWFDSLFELRAPEFLHYSPWLRPGTIVGFHDTGPHHPLRPQLDDLADQGRLRLIYLPTPRGVGLAQVL